MTSLPPWPQLSFCLAKQLVKLDIHKSFLTPVETDTLTHSLHSYSTWKDFISSSTNNLIAFRVRAMLSEQFIQSDQEQRCCSHSQIDLNQLCHEARQLDIQSCANTSSPTPSSQQHQQQTEQAQEANSNSDHVPLLDIYHTLEFDMAAMIEQRKLEEHQAQEEAQDQAAAAAAAAISTAVSISAGVHHKEVILNNFLVFNSK
jgi:transcriptional activator SPT7